MHLPVWRPQACLGLGPPGQEAGGGQVVQVTVPQAHEPGAEAEVDFGEFHAMIAGVLTKLWMFVLQLSYSGRAFHVAFACAWLSGPSSSLTAMVCSVHSGKRSVPGSSVELVRQRVSCSLGSVIVGSLLASTLVRST
jgi:hypothetical protein